jgi:hypothetical protein
MSDRAAQRGGDNFPQVPATQVPPTDRIFIPNIV